jgi:hypothetical protein
LIVNKISLSRARALCLALSLYTAVDSASRPRDVCSCVRVCVGSCICALKSGGISVDPGLIYTGSLGHSGTGSGVVTSPPASKALIRTTPALLGLPALLLRFLPSELPDD